jgi:hypothetical protein
MEIPILVTFTTLVLAIVGLVHSILLIRLQQSLQELRNYIVGRDGDLIRSQLDDEVAALTRPRNGNTSEHAGPHIYRPTRSPLDD